MTEKIIMTHIVDYDAKTKTYFRDPKHGDVVFDNIEHLIHTVAGYLNRVNPNRPETWTSNWVENQNLTGTDVRTIVSVDYDLERVVVARYYRNIWFHTEDGRTIDIRDYWQDIIEAAIAADRKLIKLKRSPIRRFHWKRRGPRPVSHISVNYRDVNLGRLARYANAEVHYEDNDYSVDILPRGRDRLFRFVWWDDFIDVRSAGWKSHKHRHQWEHNVVEREKHKKNKARKANRKGEPINDIY